MARDAPKISIYLVLYYLLTSSLVLFVFAVRPGIDGYYRASYPEMVYGRAYKPYVQRTLLPATVRLITVATPGPVKRFIQSGLEEKRMVTILGWHVAYMYEYIVGLALMLACFFGFAFVLRAIIDAVYDCPRAVADLAPIGALLVLPLLFRYYSYPYDPPTLLLFALATYAVIKKRLVLYYVAFLFATLNKETSILLAGIFFASRYKGRVDTATVLNTVAQISLWAAIQGGIAYWFRDAPGNMVEFHLVDHNLRLPFEHPISFVYSLALGVIVLWLVRSGWSAKPVFLRRALLVTFVPIFLAVFFVGYIDELRDYLEVFIFAFLLSLPTVAGAMGASCRVSNDTAESASRRIR